MTISLTIIVVLLVGYSLWKDITHQRHLERLELLIKAGDTAEFIRSTARPTGETVERVPDDTIPLEEAEPKEVLRAIKKQK